MQSVFVIMLFMMNLEKNEGIKVDILNAAPEDARGIRDVQYKTWLVTYPNTSVGITKEDIEYFYRDRLTEDGIKKKEEQIKNQGSNEHTLVAKVAGRLVGFCDVVSYKDKNQLRAIYILPDFQARGIGRNLWTQALKLIDSNLDTIVHVATYNIQAIDFYKKLGFVDTGKRFLEERFMMKSGAIIPEMEMVIKA